MLPKRPRLEFVWIYALGLGLAINALLFELFNLLGLPVNRTTLALIGLAFLSLLIVRIVACVRNHGIPSLRPIATSTWEWVTLLPLLFLAAFFLRWLPLAGLIVLPGVDSYQHAMISSLFVANEGIPSNFLPYAPLSTFTYHFGLHANTSALAMAAALPVHRVLIFFEPFLLALVALTTLVLAHAITRNHYIAFAAAVIVAFVSVFPAWYLNWARLPQLGGVVLLGLVLAILARGLDRERRITVQITIPLLTAGLFLMHYRMTVVFVYGLVALLVWRLAGSTSRKNILPEAKRVSLALSVAVILVAPWLVRLLSSFQFETALGSPLASILPPPYFYSFERIGYIMSVPTTIWLLVVVAAGLVVGIVSRRRGLVFLLVWIGLQLAFSNPYLVPLPWSGLVDFVTVMSILFVPGSIIASYAVSFPVISNSVALTRLAKRRIGPRLLYAVGLSSLIVVGGFQTGQIVRTDFTYVFPEDMEAFHWITSEIPLSAVFLTSMYISPGGLVEPTDAGVWITYFTSRKQVAPPLIYRSQKSFSDSYEAELKEFVMLERNIDQFESFEQLTLLGITHIYYGKKSSRALDIGKLDAAPWYELVYNESGVSIYKLKPMQLFDA